MLEEGERTILLRDKEAFENGGKKWIVSRMKLSSESHQNKFQDYGRLKIVTGASENKRDAVGSKLRFYSHSRVS